MIPQLVTALAVAAGAYLFYRWFQRVGEAHEKAFRDTVIEDAAAWLSQHVEAEPGELATALRELLDHQTPHPLLARLQGIDCEVTKLTPSTGRRTVVVLLNQGNGQGLIGRLTTEVGWDELPDQIREDFIRLGGETHTFRILSSAPAASEVSA